MSDIGRRIGWPLALVLLAGSFSAHADGDPAKGKKVFNKCRTCHVADAEKNKVGPYLLGVFGRPAGSVEGFKYSDAMAGSRHRLGRRDDHRLPQGSEGLRARQPDGFPRLAQG